MPQWLNFPATPKFLYSLFDDLATENYLPKPAPVRNFIVPPYTCRPKEKLFIFLYLSNEILEILYKQYNRLFQKKQRIIVPRERCCLKIL